MSHKILVVDDEPAITRLVKMSLEVEGYEVRTALGGEQALAEAELWQPDLVVLDVMMPHLDGFQVCAKMKKEPLTAHIKVLFLTALGTPEDAGNGFAAGADEYLVKPFDPDVLLDKIRALLKTEK